MNNDGVYSGWRPLRGHRYPFKPGDKNRDCAQIPTTRFFDRLCWIGDEFVGCFVLESSEGVMLVDSMMGKPGYLELLLRGLDELGHRPNEVRKVLVTHGHGDHWGNAAFFVREFGAKLYMSETDAFRAMHPERPSPSGPLSVRPDYFVGEGDTLEMGGTTVKVYDTPGHSDGCLSFIISVTDEGRPHKAALLGGVGIPRTRENCLKYIASCDHFNEMCVREGADVEIATHPFVDMTKERLEICRNIVDGVANPFVIGGEAVVRYHQAIREACRKAMPD